MNNYIQSLIKQASKLHGGVPHGLTWANIIAYGKYEEPGLTLVREDSELAHLYVAVSLYTRDLYLNNQEFIVSGNLEWINDTVVRVNKIERSRWGSVAFPYTDHGFPYKKELAKFPADLVQLASNEQLQLLIFNAPELLHEWTFKTGKRLCEAFCIRFNTSIKETLCSIDGPYGYVKDRKPIGEAMELIAATLLTDIGQKDSLTESILAPIIVCLSLYLVKEGLMLLCEN